VAATTEAVDAAGAVDAQTAPTAPWKSLRDFHKRPPPSSFPNEMKTECISHLRASKESDDTHATYRVAAFQPFLSGRISTFGDNISCLEFVGTILRSHTFLLVTSVARWSTVVG
jgi:hypothetical protein